VKAADYSKFVGRTDQYAARPVAERHAIALYGLVGEIGSLVSAVKKKILAEGGEVGWDQPNEEIKEEIGDVLWYCYSLAEIVNGGYFDILAHDIALLKREIGGQNERAEKIRAALNPASKDAFLAAAQTFPPFGGCSFDDYQKLAFKTARTDGRVLLEVCLAVLPQLGAELLRATLPEIELTLNKNIADRPANTVLGEITWHLSAIASLYHLSMNEIVTFNQAKVSFRADRGTPTPLHDDGRPSQEQFPREFDIAFIRIGPGRSRMYFQSRKLGDDLTDNANEDDGYRFHDVLHLALIAHLGWSPVVRGMMKRKRFDVDEVEDGGRAKVVEELVLKAIHSEGERQALEAGRCSVEGPVRIFPDRSTITFRLLKTLRAYVEGLEVWKNAYWEWEDAIFDGCQVFFKLREHRQGTVHVDLERRRLTFSPMVAADVSGSTVGLGMGTAAVDGQEESRKVLSEAEMEWARSQGSLAQTVAAKRALFDALGLSQNTSIPWHEVELRIFGRNRMSVDASGEVQNRIWSMRAVEYKVAFTAAAGQVFCTVAVIADADDLDK
jgi:NTP pyrophosphatase (non-canonical NTP hydrolase)